MRAESLNSNFLLIVPLVPKFRDIFIEKNNKHKMARYGRC